MERVYKMKDILIIAHFTQVPGEAGNSRFNYIAGKLNKKKANVEIVTTNFSHRYKKYRKIEKEEYEKMNYKLTMLNEPTYTKNVSIKRFYSHYVFGRSLKRYLENRKKPDVIYCAVPSLDAAFVAAKYAEKNKIKFIIDIQDLWPEAFKMIFNVPFISELIYTPLDRKASFIYSIADEIIAVSETYIKKVCKSREVNKGISVYLGTDLDYFDNIITNNNIEKPDNEIWIAYIGTLGHNYDIKNVIDAIYHLNNKGIKNIKFIIMGDGPLRNKFEQYSNKRKINCVFTGRLDYSTMSRILIKCDIAVNPIVKGAAGSIINKVGDYAAAGLPVLNTQENLEYRQLLSRYNAGINCRNNDSINLSDNILKLYKNKEIRKKMGENNRKLAKDKFDRKESYRIITQLLEDSSIKKSL